MEAAFLDPRTHGTALLQLALLALRRGEAPAAFRFADRHCRIFGPSHRNLVLRSRALRRLDLKDIADADLASAFELDPTSPIVNSELLSSGADEQRIAAAERIVRSDDAGAELVGDAARALIEAGQPLVSRNTFVGADLFCGWAVWRGPGYLTIELDTGGGIESFPLTGMSSHRYAALGQAADFSLRVANAPTGGVRFLAGGSVLAQQSRPLNLDDSVRPEASELPQEARWSMPLVQVIVPVFRDFAATTTCLNSLASQAAPFEIRVILVDDKSPEPKISAMLDVYAREKGFALVRNTRNLGFVGAVNEALKFYDSGDLLLLNADTILPSGAIERLRNAVYSSPTIGTATPFSNNGEFVSFPKPFSFNPLPSLPEVAALDALFAACNRDLRIPVPSGVGFCLYVKADCYRAVGKLSHLYSPGYGEDADFCLAAREKGFLSVCAADVYVGHAGARSFAENKRRLVARNLKFLNERFPVHQAESAAFVSIDPLREARVRVEDSMAGPGGALLIAPASVRAEAAASERVRQIRAETPDICLLQLWPASEGRAFEIRADAGFAPQSLRFDLTTEDGRERASSYLRRTKLQRIELIDPGALSPELGIVLAGAEARIDIFAADATPFRTLARPGGCKARQTPEPCADCANSVTDFQAARGQAAAVRNALSGLITDKSRVWCADPMSEAVARRIHKKVEVVAAASLREVRQIPPRQRQMHSTLAILAPTRSSEVEKLILAVQRCFNAVNPGIEILVLGACLNDLRVLAGGNAFVSGPIRVDEYPGALERYAANLVFCPYRHDHFWVFNSVEGAQGIRRAYFDWSFGDVTCREGDLAMDPRLCDAMAARALAGWTLSSDGANAI